MNVYEIWFVHYVQWYNFNIIHNNNEEASKLSPIFLIQIIYI
jgi:hypothetical protein